VLHFIVELGDIKLWGKMKYWNLMEENLSFLINLDRLGSNHTASGPARRNMCRAKTEAEGKEKSWKFDGVDQ
jgi:hypothetical protein